MTRLASFARDLHTPLAMSAKAIWIALLVLVAAGCGATSHDGDASRGSGGANSTGDDATASSSNGGSGGTAEGVGATGGSGETGSGGNSGVAGTGTTTGDGGEAGSGGNSAVAGTGATGASNTCALELPPAPKDEPSSWVLALDGLATRWAEAYCAYYSRCQYGFERGFSDLPGACVGFYERDIANFRVALLVAGLESGRAFYDEAAMDACFEAATTGACGDVDLFCEDAAGGLVPPGEACGSWFDCEGEATCSVEECPGNCVPVDDREPTQSEGMPCDDAACVPRLVCLHEEQFIDPSFNDGRPTETNTCVVPAEANEPCPSTTPGTIYPCADDGYVCAQDPDGFLRCLPELTEGDECYDFGPPCQGGLICLEVEDGSSVCSQFVYVGLDEPCGLDIECAPGTTCATVALESSPTDRVCVAEAAPGGTCYSIGDNCPADEYCVTPEPPEGEIQLTGTCEPRKSVGETCETDDECGPFMYCWCGVCEAMAQIDEACRHDVACWSGKCVDGVCASPSQCP